MLGTPPRGQQGAGGGGDCGIAFGKAKNSRGNYQYAYTGLGPLTGFVTSTSPNNGRNLTTGGPFGNLVTNIDAEHFRGLGYSLGDRVPLTIEGRSFVFPFVRTFADVPIGKPLLYIDSRGRLAVAINQGDFAQAYRIGRPAGILIVPKPR